MDRRRGDWTLPFKTLTIDYFQEVAVWDAKVINCKGENLCISFRIWQQGSTWEMVTFLYVGNVLQKAHPVCQTARSKLSVKMPWLIYRFLLCKFLRCYKKRLCISRFDLRNKLWDILSSWYLENYPGFQIPWWLFFFWRAMKCGNKI